MSTALDGLAHIQNFLRLDFLFSGLEVSSPLLFAARALVFVVLVVGIISALVKVVLKVLDCIQTFLAGLSRLPRSFFLVLLLAIPLSSDSLGARWAGYILLLLLVFGLVLVGMLTAVLWKYGVDQTLRLIETLGRRTAQDPRGEDKSDLPPDNIVGELPTPSRTGAGRATILSNAG